MIRHIVLLRFRAAVLPEARAALMTELDGLRAHLHGMVTFTPLTNLSPETPVIHGFTQGFAIDFTDAAARDAYLADSRHVDIGRRLTEACEGGTEGVLVFDHAL